MIPIKRLFSLTSSDSADGNAAGPRKSRKDAERADRKARLNAALRENLRRRKAQDQARREQAAPGKPESE